MIISFSTLYIILVLDEVFPRHVSFLRIWDFCLTMTWKLLARRPSSSKPTRWEVNFNNLWCHILMLGRHVGRSVDTEWLYSKWNSTDADASGTFATAGWVIPFEISSDHLNLVWQKAWDPCGSPKNLWDQAGSLCENAWFQAPCFDSSPIRNIQVDLQYGYC